MKLSLKRPIALMMCSLAGVVLLAHDLPLPNHAMYFGYYNVDGADRHGGVQTDVDHTPDVFPYTNLYLALPNDYFAGTYSSTVCNSAAFATSLQRAANAGKAIYLMLPDSCNLGDTIELARSSWSQVKMIEVFHEGNPSPGDVNAKIATVKNAILGKGLSADGVKFGIMMGLCPALGRADGDPCAAYNPDTEASFGSGRTASSLDYYGIEAYLPLSQQRDDDVAGLLSTALQQAKGRIPSGKQAIFVGMAYDRNGLWDADNLDRLVALQNVAYKASYNDPRILGISLFSFLRIGGTIDYPRLRTPHLDMAEQIFDHTFARLTDFQGEYNGGSRAHRSDLAVFRPGAADDNWFAREAVSGGASILQRRAGEPYATEPDLVPVPGDYDGDGSTDVAVWRPTDGKWYITKSSTGFTSSFSPILWGNPALAEADWVPVPADYDGDKVTDIAIWNRNSGDWYVLTSRSHFTSEWRPAQRLWGNPAPGLSFVPVPGDYDGDGFADRAVWSRTTGRWYVWLTKFGDTYPSASEYDRGLWPPSGITSQFIAVPGDYDGDGKTDLAVWKAPTTGVAGQWSVQTTGETADVIKTVGSLPEGWEPVVGDFDGDGRTDMTVWRPSDGQWFILSSAGNTTSRFTQWVLPGTWGSQPTDMPLPRPPR